MVVGYRSLISLSIWLVDGDEWLATRESVGSWMSEERLTSFIEELIYVLIPWHVLRFSFR